MEILIFSVQLISVFPLQNQSWNTAVKSFAIEMKISANFQNFNKIQYLYFGLNETDEYKCILHLIDTVNKSVRNLETVSLNSNLLGDSIFDMMIKFDDSYRER